MTQTFRTFIPRRRRLDLDNMPDNAGGVAQAQVGIADLNRHILVDHRRQHPLPPRS